MLGALLETCQAIPGGCCSVGSCAALAVSGVSSASCSRYVMHSTFVCSIFARCFLARGEFAIVRAAASHVFVIVSSTRCVFAHVAVITSGMHILLLNADHVMSANGARIALPMLRAAPFAVVTSHQLGLELRAVSRSQFCLVL